MWLYRIQMWLRIFCHFPYSFPDSVRSSRLQMFFKIDIPRTFKASLDIHRFCKIYRKAPVLESLFNEVADLSLQLQWKETPAEVFSCEFYEIFKKISFIAHLWWLLLFCWQNCLPKEFLKDIFERMVKRCVKSIRNRQKHQNIQNKMNTPPLITFPVSLDLTWIIVIFKLLILGHFPRFGVSWGDLFLRVIGFYRICL